MGTKLSSIGGRMARARAAQQSQSDWWHYSSPARNHNRRTATSGWAKHLASATKNEARRIRLSPGN